MPTNKAIIVLQENSGKTPFDDSLPTDLRAPINAIEVLKYINPNRILTSLTLLADTYCRGIDCQLGIILGKASYQLSQTYFETISAKINHLRATNKGIEYTEELQDLEDWLTLIGNNAENSAVSCAVGFQSLGQHRELIKFVSDAINWFESKGYQEAVPTLLLTQIDSYIELAEYDKAEELLSHTNWEKLLTKEHFADRDKKQILEQKLEDRIKDPRILPPEPQKDRDAIIALRKQMLNSVKSMVEGLSPEDADLFYSLEDVLEQKMMDVPDSLAEWATQSQSMMDVLTKFISGGGKEFNQLQNQQRIRNAAVISLDPKTGRNPEIIKQSVPILIQALDWAIEHNFREDENDALWSLYLYYSRTQQETQAIEVLQKLRTNLEKMRESITDPMKRAGIMRKFPNLFGALCQLLYRSNRVVELLDAIEGAKGRVLADIRTKQIKQAVSEQSFSKSVRQLPILMQQVKAHYLTYLVNEEETFAVLVAKDGSLHTHKIEIGKTHLQELFNYNDPNYNPLNPAHWGKIINHRKKLKVINDLPDRLASFVSWLEPLAKSGLLKQNDHLCYCPDEYLHLIPLHYLPFRGKPIVRFLSVSRIQSAVLLNEILNLQIVRPTQYTSIDVSTQSDRGLSNTEQKLHAFQAVKGWLKRKMPSGDVVSEEHADIKTVIQLPFEQRLVHFATHGVFRNKTQDSKVNPYDNSGLVLAKEGHLPGDSEGEDATLFTPQQLIEGHLNFSGSHVTLSACVSGLAKEGIGGDALGLEWAFLLAGANSLLATHWNADAGRIANFSFNFYQRWLLEGNSRVTAWHKTVLELMDHQETSHPYYWAAFSLSGDWR